MALAARFPMTQAGSATVEPWSPRFSAAARAVAAACRATGLVVPGFRSPPAVAGVDRTLRRWPDGRCVVAVRAAGRRHEPVVDDLIEGVLAANELRGAAASEARSALVRKLREAGELAGCCGEVADVEEVVPKAG